MKTKFMFIYQINAVINILIIKVASSHLSEHFSPLTAIRFKQLTFLQTTDKSEVDIFTQSGMSHSHYMLVSGLSHQDEEGVVLL